MKLTDGQARRIAADWNGGARSPLSRLATTGAILDTEELRAEIAMNLHHVQPGSVDAETNRRELLALDGYVHYCGDRPAVPGWAQIWDASAVLD